MDYGIKANGAVENCPDCKPGRRVINGLDIMAGHTDDGTIAVKANIVQDKD